MWREQAITEWSRRMISIIACCHSAKLCAHAAWSFSWQDYIRPTPPFQWCTESEIFDSDSIPALAEYTSTHSDSDTHLSFAFWLLLWLQIECYKLFTKCSKNDSCSKPDFCEKINSGSTPIFEIHKDSAWNPLLHPGRDDHYPVCRLDIRQDSEFATGYGYPKTTFKREPVSSEISGLCEISDLILFVSYFASQRKNYSLVFSFLRVLCKLKHFWLDVRHPQQTTIRE